MLGGDSRHHRQDGPIPRLSRKIVIPDLERDRAEHEPDAASSDALSSGTAALLLVESLIHHLVKRAILSTGEAIEIVDIAAEVEREMASGATGNAAAPSAGPSLAAISSSLRFDLPD